LVKPAGVGRSVMHQCVEDHLRAYTNATVTRLETV
jgi:hypothetical protein